MVYARPAEVEKQNNIKKETLSSIYFMQHVISEADEDSFRNYLIDSQTKTTLLSEVAFIFTIP